MGAKKKKKQTKKRSGPRKNKDEVAVLNIIDKMGLTLVADASIVHANPAIAQALTILGQATGASIRPLVSIIKKPKEKKAPKKK